MFINKDMGFKRYYLQETDKLSLEELIVESFLFEDAEINTLRQQLMTTDDPEEKKRLGMEFQQLVKQKKKERQTSNNNDAKQNKLQKFADKVNLSPEEVQKIIKQTTPSSKYVDILLKWWDSGKFKPNDSILFRQIFTNHERYGEDLNIDKYNDPKQLESALDQIIHKREASSITKEINDKPIYTDDNIDVFHGSDRHRCIKYGKGKQHTLCVAQPSASNLYLGYRSRGATFYFIYFKNEQAERGQLKEGVDFIVIHVYPDHMKVNYVEPNIDKTITEQELISKFPSIKPVFDKGIIQHIGHTDDENEQFKVNGYSNIRQTKNYKEALTYIEIGRAVKDNDWVELEKRGYNIKELVEKYVNTGVGDIPMELIDKYKLNSRYEEMLIRRVNAKKGNGLTPHEYESINRSENKSEIIKVIASDPNNAFTYAKGKGFENIEPEIVNAYGGFQGIVSDPKWAFFYAKEKGFENIEPEIENAYGGIKGIASNPEHAVEYAKTKRFENIEPEIIKGIASDPTFAYYYAHIKDYQLDPQTEAEVITSISTNSMWAFIYAQGKGFKLDPQADAEIIKGIARDHNKAIEYAKEKGFENIEPEIIRGIASNPDHAYLYASKKGFQLDPQTDAKIIKGIANDPYLAFKYAEEKRFENIEPDIIRGIASNQWWAFEYAKRKGVKELPELIYRALEQSGKLPPEATMEQ